MSGPKRVDGPLAGQVEGYRAWLVQRGYTPGTVRNMLKDLGRVGRWLSGRGLNAADFSEQVVGVFLSDLRQAGAKRVPGPRAMAPLLEFLRSRGVAPEEIPASTPLEVLMDCYRTWMLRDRGLAPTTVLRYENTARRFLREECLGSGDFLPSALTGANVNAFLLRECGRVSTGSAKGRVAELRAVLRFLYLQGITEFQLGSAVPPVGGWRLASLPPDGVSPGDVQLLLDGIDRSTLVGARDFAIALLVARLGLRSIEVSRLELSDVDWRAGELVVRGKARRQDRMPLPAEVGEAMVEYLSHGRNPAGDVHVFLTCRAPRGPIRADLVGDVIERASKRAGLPKFGPHRLRHALAGEMLKQGAGLMAISQVLRHQDLATTALYAKVDIDSLRRVAQPWPGSVR